MRALPTLLLAGLLAVVAASPAGARTTPTSAWTVPSQARITISGHGYGHGHGMSQYGAEGAARAGLDYRQIAEFYYPGTGWGVGKGRVSVLITADTTDDLIVLAEAGLTVRDTGPAAGSRVALPDNGAKQWRVATGPDGVTRVSYLTQRWHRWSQLSGLGEFYAGGDPITLVTPSGERAYRGRLRVATTSSGDRVTVNELRLDNYLKGVVPLEIPASWSPDAVRAQAVAARTYAAYERMHPQSVAYQLCDTGSCQVYGGYDAEYDASNAAVDTTRHQVLTSGGNPAFTQFGSSNGGWTAAGGVSYLPAEKDPYDGWSGNPVHTWKTVVDDTRLEQAWPAIGDLTRIAVGGRDGNGAWGGRVGSLTLTGTAGKATVSGDTFRSVLGLKSTWFTFKVAQR